VVVPVERATTRGRRRTAGKRGSKGSRRQRPIEASDAAPGVVEALRSWRLAEARAQGIPAFRILTDRQLVAIAEASPRAVADLRTVSGFGSKRVQRYGAAIVRIVRGADA
jgi:DNA topoisomerase-3